MHGFCALESYDIVLRNASKQDHRLNTDSPCTNHQVGELGAVDGDWADGCRDKGMYLQRGDGARRHARQHPLEVVALAQCLGLLLEALEDRDAG